jgi:hypothetical protein
MTGGLARRQLGGVLALRRQLGHAQGIGQPQKGRSGRILGASLDADIHSCWLPVGVGRVQSSARAAA